MLEVQREEDVVVVADDLPQVSVAEVAVCEDIEPFAVGDGMERIIVSRGGVDSLPYTDAATVSIPVKDARCIARVLAYHWRTSV